MKEMNASFMTLDPPLRCQAIERMSACIRKYSCTQEREWYKWEGTNRSTARGVCKDLMDRDSNCRADCNGATTPFLSASAALRPPQWWHLTLVVTVAATAATYLNRGAYVCVLTFILDFKDECTLVVMAILMYILSIVFSPTRQLQRTFTGNTTTNVLVSKEDAPDAAPLTGNGTNHRATGAGGNGGGTAVPSATKLEDAEIKTLKHNAQKLAEENKALHEEVETMKQALKENTQRLEEENKTLQGKLLAEITKSVSMRIQPAVFEDVVETASTKRKTNASVSDGVLAAIQATAQTKAMGADPIEERRQLISKCKGGKMKSTGSTNPDVSQPTDGVLDILDKFPGMLFCRYTDSCTPLHAAAAGGQDKVVRLLIAKGANAFACDNQGRLPLHMAAKALSETCCRILMQEMERVTKKQPVGPDAPLDLTGVSPAGWVAKGFRPIKKPEVLDPKEMEDECSETQQSKMRLAFAKKEQKYNDIVDTMKACKSLLHVPGDLCISPMVDRCGGTIDYEFAPPIMAGSAGSPPRPPLTAGSAQQDTRGSLQLHYGASEIPGWRVTMEDAIAINLNLALPPGTPGCANVTESSAALFAIFDGHGGCDASAYAAKHIVEHVMHNLSTAVGGITKGANGEAAGSETKEGGGGVDGGSSRGNGMQSDSFWTAVLQGTFFDLDQAMREAHQKLDHNGNSMGINPIAGGCTAIVAIVMPSIIVVANCGDCRAVLATRRPSGAAAVGMTLDHKITAGPTHAPVTWCNVEKERARIMQAGGTIRPDGYITANKSKPIAVGRALGDFLFKANTDLKWTEQAICALPDVTFHPRGGDSGSADEDVFMVLACDGVWDVMSNQEVVDYVVARRQKRDEHGGTDGLESKTADTMTPVAEVRCVSDGGSPASASASTLGKLSNDLVLHCLAKGSTDNMSAVIVSLSDTFHPTTTPHMLATGGGLNVASAPGRLRGGATGASSLYASPYISHSETVAFDRRHARVRRQGGGVGGSGRTLTQELAEAAQ